MQNKLLTVASLVAMKTTAVWACNASHVLGTGGAGAVYTISADTMTQGSFYLGLSVESVQNKTLSDSTILTALQSGVTHLHNVDAVNAYSLSLSYGLKEKLSLNIQLPYVSRTNIRAGENNAGILEVHPHADAQGLSDISALLQYQIYNKALKLALLGGIKVPTGKTNIQEANEFLEADLQAGSGSWDFFAGFAVSKDFENYSLHSNILYKYNTQGIASSRLGDTITYNAALSYKIQDQEDTLCKLTPHHDEHNDVNVFIELNGESAQRDSFNGVIANNTGHTVVFATTGVQIATPNHYAFSLTYSLPVYQNFNGIQNSIDYKLSLGMGRSF